MQYEIAVLDTACLNRVKGDLKPDLTFQIFNNETEEPKNLTNYSITFTMKKIGGQNPKIKSQACIKTDEINGECKYLFKTTEVDEYGEFLGEVQLVDINNKIQTVYGQIQISIRNNLQ